MMTNPAPDTNPDNGQVVEGLNDTSNPPVIQYQLPARRPMVTYLLMALTVLVYAGQVLTRQVYQVDLPAAFGMKINEAIINGQVWRLVTPVLLHADVIHILFNMYALFAFGRRMERFYGHSRFTWLYLLAGLSGNIFSFYFQAAPSLGASTAIFGLVAAEGIFIYTNRKFFPNAGRALREIIMIVAINLVLGFSAQFDNWGHLGGLVGGAAFAWFAGPFLDIRNTAEGLQIYDRHHGRLAWQVTVAESLILILLAAVRITSA